MKVFVSGRHDSFILGWNLDLGGPFALLPSRLVIASPETSSFIVPSHWPRQPFMQTGRILTQGDWRVTGHGQGMAQQPLEDDARVQCSEGLAIWWSVPSECVSRQHPHSLLYPQLLECVFLNHPPTRFLYWLLAFLFWGRVKVFSMGWMCTSTFESPFCAVSLNSSVSVFSHAG